MYGLSIARCGVQRSIRNLSMSLAPKAWISLVQYFLVMRVHLHTRKSLKFLVKRLSSGNVGPKSRSSSRVNATSCRLSTVQRETSAVLVSSHALPSNLERSNYTWLVQPWLSKPGDVLYGAARVELQGIRSLLVLLRATYASSRLQEML